MNTRPQHLLILALIIAIAWWFFDSESEPIVPTADVKIAPETPTNVELDNRSKPVSRKLKPPGVKARDLEEDFPLATLVISPLTNNERSDDIVNEISNEIYLDAPGFYKRIIAKVEEGDADAAYAYYLFLQHCKSAMRTQRELDFRTIAWADYAERESADLDDAVRAAVRRFERCSVLDPGLDLSRETIKWLTLAADMGHMTAQLQYYKSARDELVSSLLGIREPGHFFVYHDRARAYLRNLLETGHPEAIYRMGIATMDGVIFEKNDVLAFAYFLLAEKEGYIERGPIGIRNHLESRLTIREVREAKKLSRELCESICTH